MPPAKVVPDGGASGASDALPVDLPALYDAHPEYVERRRAGSLSQAQVDLEVRLFKLPRMLALWPEVLPPASVVEIGCATGELIAAFPVRDGGVRVGIDISPENVAAARRRHPQVRFEAGDFRSVADGIHYDLVLLSDVIEHVPDDAGFLADAARLGRYVLVNLPLEDNWLNALRAYGPDDVSGHLRRYGLSEGLALFGRAGLHVLDHRRVWIHETEAEAARRELRRSRTGQAYGGGWLGRRLRRAVFGVATAVPPIGRRLFASNLFALARTASDDPRS